ncbi:hypothetical protein M8494_13365 [Serratia ureilytica]
MTSVPAPLRRWCAGVDNAGVSEEGRRRMELKSLTEPLLLPPPTTQPAPMVSVTPNVP